VLFSQPLHKTGEKMKHEETDKTESKEAKPKPGRGGKRPGAGRKPDYFKQFGISKVTAADILAHHDEPAMWNWLLKHARPDLRFKALQYLTDRRDGKPKQAVEIGGGVAHTIVPYRDPRLANLSPEDLQALDELTKKLLPAAQKGPVNQIESKPEIEPDAPVGSGFGTA
jgi:hypothetical protein